MKREFNIGRRVCRCFKYIMQPRIPICHDDCDIQVRTTFRPSLLDERNSANYLHRVESRVGMHKQFHTCHDTVFNPYSPPQITNDYYSTILQVRSRPPATNSRQLLLYMMMYSCASFASSPEFNYSKYLASIIFVTN